MAMVSFKNIDLEKKRIILISAGNQLAFKELFDLYHKRIFQFAMKYLRSEHLAEEAVQDIFLKIWENREELVFVDDFSSWVFRLTKNYLLNFLKRASTESRIKDEISKTLIYAEEINNDLLVEKETTDMLYAIIEELPTQRQEIFKLCRFEQKSYEEAAVVMGISKSTVNDHMVKAMKYLKNNIPKNLYEQ
jgi:RNA polymerase sigma-70 factor (ECF subfamily)